MSSVGREIDACYDVGSFGGCDHVRILFLVPLSHAYPYPDPLSISISPLDYSIPHCFGASRRVEELLSFYLFEIRSSIPSYIINIFYPCRQSDILELTHVPF